MICMDFRLLCITLSTSTQPQQNIAWKAQKLILKDCIPSTALGLGGIVDGKALGSTLNHTDLGIAIKRLIIALIERSKINRCKPSNPTLSTNLGSTLRRGHCRDTGSCILGDSLHLAGLDIGLVLSAVSLPTPDLPQYRHLSEATRLSPGLLLS